MQGDVERRLTAVSPAAPKLCRMSDKARIKIAATVTAMFLAAISAAGVIAHGNSLPAATPVTASAPAHTQGQLHFAPTSYDSEHD